MKSMDTNPTNAYSTNSTMINNNNNNNQGNSLTPQKFNLNLNNVFDSSQSPFSDDVEKELNHQFGSFR